MEVNCIIKEDGLLIEEGTTTDPEDSLLECEDEIQSVQIQHPTDKPRERQDEQSLKSPTTATRSTNQESGPTKKLPRASVKKSEIPKSQSLG